MPRQPTGRPPGRPVGSGAVLEREQVRLTVRIPTTLYKRLEAFAETAHFIRGTPQLAGCVRDALDHFLTCPHRRQTQNVHIGSNANNGQTENGTVGTHRGQTDHGADTVVPVLALAGDDNRQTTNCAETQGSIPVDEPGENGQTVHGAASQPETAEQHSDANRQTGNVPALEADSAGESMQTPRECRMALVLETLPHDGAGITPVAIRTKTGLSKIAVANDLRDLGKRGDVFTLGKGRYARRQAKPGDAQ